MKSALAAAAGGGLTAADVTLSIEAASVAITAEFSHSDPTQASTANSNLQSSLASAETASTALGVNVVSDPVVTAAEEQVVVPAPLSPPSRPPSPAAPPLRPPPTSPPSPPVSPPACTHVLQWTQQFGTSSRDAAYGVRADASGNVYVAGFTDSSFDGAAHAGGQDVFVSKYSGTGLRQWTQLLGTSVDDNAYGVSTDASGNVYVTGYTYGSLDGGTHAGSRDAFVSKYSGAGVRQWTRQLGSSTWDEAHSVSVDASGGVYVAGYTDGDLDGNGNRGSWDAFVAKYSGAGELQWTRQLGTNSSDVAYGVSVDSSGNVYVAGRTSGGLDGGTHVGSDDAFVSKYSSAGVRQWTRQLGTASDDFAGGGVTVDAFGDVYVTGYTSGGLDGNAHVGGADVFVSKYSGAGVRQWTRQLGTTSSDEAWGVSTDASGNVYVAGRTSGGLDGGTHAGGDDVFVSKYSSAGVRQWTQQLGSSVADVARGVSVDSSGNVYVAGYTSGGLDGNANAGQDDPFVSKYGCPVLPPSSPPATPAPSAPPPTSPPSAPALTVLTDANIYAARDAWLSDPAAATATYGHISTWDVGRVTSLREMFCARTSWSSCNSAASTFNENISGWDTSSVTDLYCTHGIAWHSRALARRLCG